MTVQESDLIEAPPTGDPAIIEILRRLHADATQEADRLASIGGHERETAQEHLARAAIADEAAMAARAYAERWRRHLDYELVGPVDVPGDVEDESPQTAPVRRTPYGPTP